MRKYGKAVETPLQCLYKPDSFVENSFLCFSCNTADSKKRLGNVFKTFQKSAQKNIFKNQVSQISF